ncbi:GGDEF domain-containing protein [Rheinheimera sp.]|uniref:GGDEF domain-containing protein n=1 Tax=Rheinheimera sp. TaxID=1869214 RepID=UPI0025CD2F8D|nr:sensor domain-containing diguanylate cyclase [Rheinheimera sp.]
MTMPDFKLLLQPLQLYPWHFVVLAFLGALFGAALFAVLVYRRQLKWQQETAEQLEENIQTRTFELQVALNELADKNRILEEQNTQDALTGVRNRAYFDKKIQAELKRSRREQRPLALVMLDIDHFKQINDNHGHLAGDAVIKGVAEKIARSLKRSSDYVCRYGGEEFALILPNTDAAGVFELAEQIRLSIAAHPFDTEIGPLPVQISAGCYAAVAAPDMVSTDFIHAADQALYQAKTAGRNQVILAAASDPAAPAPAQEGNPDELVQ